MRSDIVEARAAKIRPFSGSGMTYKQVADAAGVSVATVKKYALACGLEIGRRQVVDFEEVKDCAERGLTRFETCDELGISISSIARACAAGGIRFKHGHTGVGVDFGRADAMAAMYRGGKTLHEIGEVFGVTRERVRQIIKKYHGITAKDGGKKTKAARNVAKKANDKNAECIRKYGCTYDQFRSLLAIGKDIQAQGASAYRTPIGAWRNQKRNAIARGIEWRISLWEWWSIWQESGKWDARGRCKDDYVMCRFKDDGAYEVGNVYIATQSHNCSFQPNNPYRRGHPDHEKVMAAIRRKVVTRVPRKTKNHDLPLGVSRSTKSNRCFAQINIAGQNHYLGTFDTADEAHAAYLAAAQRAGIGSTPSLNHTGEAA